MSSVSLTWWVIGGLLLLFVVVVVRLLSDHARWHEVLSAKPVTDVKASIELMEQSLREQCWQDARHLIVPGGASAVARALHAEATSGWAWRLGSVFTAIALIATFAIIGSVMQGLPLDDSTDAGGKLKDAVDSMGSKFWISAVGVGATLAYQLVVGLLGGSLRDKAREYAKSASSIVMDERAWERHAAEQRSEAVNQRLQARLGELVDQQSSQLRYARLAVEEAQKLESRIRSEAGAARQDLEGLTRGLAMVVGVLREEAKASRATIDAGFTRAEAGSTRISEVLTAVGQAVQNIRVIVGDGSDLVRAQTVRTGQASEAQLQQLQAMTTHLQELRERGTKISQRLKAMDAALAGLNPLSANVSTLASRVDSIDASIQGGLGPLVDNVGKMADTVLGPRIDELVQRLQRALGEELAQQFQPLRDELRAQSKEEQLRDAAEHIQAVVTGSASESTKAFNETMARLNASLPTMLEQIREAAQQAQEANQQAFAALAAESVRSEVRLGRLQEVVEASVDNVKTVVDALVAHAQEVLQSVATQTQGALDSVAKQTATTAAGVFERFDALHEQVAATHHATTRAAAEERSRAAAEKRDWADSLAALNKEMAGAVDWLRREREAVKGLAAEVAARADQLETQRKAGNEAVQRAIGVSEVAERLLKELRRQVEDDHKLHAETRLQIASIRTQREELESALQRIASEVSKVLARDLKVINEQIEKNGRVVSEMADAVSNKLAMPLAEAAQDLRDVADKLGKQTGGNGRGAAVVSAGGPQ